MKKPKGHWKRLLFGDGRSVRFRRPMHRTLAPLLRLPQFLDRRIGFVTAQARNRYTWIKSRWVRQIVSHGAKHVGMTINAVRDLKSDLFFIFEHKAEYSVPLYLILLLRRKPVFFFVHDMQQCATRKFRSRVALNICRACVRLGEFYPVFIALNDAGLDASSRFAPEKALTIPHPHHLADQHPLRPARAPGTRFRVGVIETTRVEKSIESLVGILRKAQEHLDFQLVIGAPLWRNPSWTGGPGLEVRDTGTEAQFSEFLRSVDIFVVDFVKDDYFRPSGAIVDAGMNGCYVLCPDFPIMREQISQPVSIGATFDHLEEIPALLAQAMKRLDAKPLETETWRNHHRFDRIAGQFKTFLQKREALL